MNDFDKLKGMRRLLVKALDAGNRLQLALQSEGEDEGSRLVEASIALVAWERFLIEAKAELMAMVDETVVISSKEDKADAGQNATGDRRITK